MSRVLGTKVTDSLYDRFCGLSGTMSSNLRDAAEMYLKHRQDSKVNQVNPISKQECFDCKYKDLCYLMDKHLEAENDNTE